MQRASHYPPGRVLPRVVVLEGVHWGRQACHVAPRARIRGARVTDQPSEDPAEDLFADLEVSWLREADLVDEWTDASPAPEPTPAPPPETATAPEPEPEPVAPVPEPQPPPQPAAFVAPEPEPVAPVPAPQPEPVAFVAPELDPEPVVSYEAEPVVQVPAVESHVFAPTEPPASYDARPYDDPPNFDLSKFMDDPVAPVVDPVAESSVATEPAWSEADWTPPEPEPDWSEPEPDPVVEPAVARPVEVARRASVRRERKPRPRAIRAAGGEHKRRSFVTLVSIVVGLGLALSVGVITLIAVATYVIQHALK